MARELTDVDTAGVEKMPGVVKIVRDGNFLAVVAEREYQAIKAMRALAPPRAGKKRLVFRKQDELAAMLTRLPAQDTTILDQRGDSSGTERQSKRRYTRPYQMHGSIGPVLRGRPNSRTDALTVWTHTQGVYPDRRRLRKCCSMPPEQRALHPYGRVRLLRTQRRR